MISHYEFTPTMQGRLLVAVRDLDPPSGGAEKSLSSLLLGLENWGVKVYQSKDRGRETDVFHNSSILFEKSELKIEDIYSGLAWKFRNKRTERTLKPLRKIHLKRKNKLFSKWLTPHILSEKETASKNNIFLLGVTQLDWSAGAATSFMKANIPYVTFVRDEVCFENPELFRPCLENAHTVIVAGTGLANQIKEKFSIKSISVVRLPVDFEKIYPQENLEQKLKDAQIFRVENNLTNPRIGVVGMVPEKGFQFYNDQFIPKLKQLWPEATLHVYGGGDYAKRLAKHSNTFDEGFQNQEEIFPYCDIHMFRLDRIGSWGRVINEAGYFNRPSISIDIGAQAEAVGKGGAVVPYNSTAEEWINKIKEIYEDLERYGILAYEHRLIVDYKNSVKEFKTLIDGVLNRYS